MIFSVKHNFPTVLFLSWFIYFSLIPLIIVQMQILRKGKEEIENTGSSQHSHCRIKALSGMFFISMVMLALN